jgi:hypothetical protein
MKLPQPPPQLTAVEFNTALKEAGFGVQHARIVDTSGRCPGFVTTPAFRGRGVMDRTKTLTRVRLLPLEFMKKHLPPWASHSAHLSGKANTHNIEPSGLRTSGTSVDRPLASPDPLPVVTATYCLPLTL